MIVKLLDELIKLTKSLRPTERSEKARRYSILITELEILYAYAKEYGL